MVKDNRELRVKAAMAFEWAHHDRPQAKERLALTYKGKLPSRAGRYCEKWNRRLQSMFSVEDAPRSGRPRFVSDAALEPVLQRFIQGWPDTKQWRGWKSFGQALRNDEDLHQMVERLQLSKKQVFTRMKLVSCSTLHERASLLAPCMPPAASGSSSNSHVWASAAENLPKGVTFKASIE